MLSLFFGFTLKSKDALSYLWEAIDNYDMYGNSLKFILLFKLFMIHL